MENRFCFKLLRGVVAGLAVTATFTQAADIGAPLLEDPYGRAMAPPPAIPSAVNQDDRDAALKGAQGPVRTEAGDQMVKADQERVRRDLEGERYPVGKGVAIP